MKNFFSAVGLVASLAAFVSVASAQDEGYWNQFRGPTGDGRSLETDLPVEFGETKNVRWKTPIHDQGWSSPVVWGDRVWLTTAREDGTELFAVCVDLDSGELVHDIKVFDVAEPQLDHPGLNTHATPTPIVEDGRVYVHFGPYGTACLGAKSGEKLWERRDLKCDHRVRPASSPIIDGDSLFLTFDGVDAQFVAALDKNTGETLWLQDRGAGFDFVAKMKAEGISEADAVETATTGKPGDNRKSYATPTIIEHEGRRQLISPGAEVTFSYDPKTGEEFWRVVHEGWGWNVTCRPVFANGLVYLTEGVSRRLVAVRPSGTGDVTDTHIVWEIDGRGAPEISSPLAVDGLLFTKSDSGGSISCLDATTGEQIWRGRLPGGGTFWASPVYADRKIYIASMKGAVYVISAGREFELIAVNRFESLTRRKGASVEKKDASRGEEGTEKLVEQMKAKDMSDAEIKEWFDDEAGQTGASQNGFVASPAVANNVILLRSGAHLYCIAEESK